MKLFQPGKIGKLALKNRIIMASMGNRLTELDGRFSQRAIDYYAARAKGGVGLIITCASRLRQIEQLPFAPLTDRMMLDRKIYSGRLNELVEAVHDYGAKLAVQFMAGRGRTAELEVVRTGGAVGPSPLSCIADPSVMTRELTEKETAQLTQSFQYAAELVRGAGTDAIEISAHAGHICDEFMTSIWNKRTDKYGGSLDNRLRFLIETIESIQRGAGADFPIIVKYGLTHYMEGGREIEEGIEIARKLEAAGVAAVCVDAGSYETMYWFLPTSYQAPGCLTDLAEKVKKAVKIPVIAVGKLDQPEVAEKVLQDGKADFIALGKGLLADPEWAKKVKEGRLEDISPCIGDHEGCFGRTLYGKPVSCTVTPSTGMEKEWALIPAEKKKAVLVVGGGPGGMEVARIAAMRGHKVTLCDKGSALGGNLIPAAVPDFKHDYRRLIDFLSTQIEKLGVEIKLGTEVTPKLVQSMKPDAVFIATGGTPIIPEIPGVKNKNVATAIDVIMGNKKAGKSVVVIGAGSIGCETALHMAQKGKSVTIVEVLDKPLNDMVIVNRMYLLKLLEDAKVKLLTGTKVSEITDEGVVIAGKIGKKSTIKADTVVLAVGLKPNDTLSAALDEKVAEVYTIGDCVEPRNVMNAMREGFRFARLV